MVKVGLHHMVRVAPLVVEEEKKKILHNCLVGFLKPTSAGIRAVESQLQKVWGKMTIATKMMDEETMLVQLNSFKEVEEIMANANDPHPLS